jgi:hypothetical protein
LPGRPHRRKRARTDPERLRIGLVALQPLMNNRSPGPQLIGMARAGHLEVP